MTHTTLVDQRNLHGTLETTASAIPVTPSCQSEDLQRVKMEENVSVASSWADLWGGSIWRKSRPGGGPSASVPLSFPPAAASRSRD